MRPSTLASWLLLSAALGCSDAATIGGLCPKPCLTPDCDARPCSPPTAADSGSCPGAGCPADACAAQSCRDAAPGLADACAMQSCGDMDAGPACLDGAFPLTRKRLNWVVVVDNTASLAPWWPFLYDGLTRFLQSDAASGLGIGLMYFDENCDAQQYAANPLVPIAPLPDNWPALQQAIPTLLSASTSTIPALDGALRYARSWSSANADIDVAVVLLTDASPGACDGLSGDYEGEAQRIAREAYEATPSIPSYVIGFSVLGTVSLIARAGGTEPRLISVTPTDDDVPAALASVRQERDPCIFRWAKAWMPAPSADVVRRSADGSERRYPILPNASGCDQQDGFYVEDPSAAFPLIACARTCMGLEATDRLALSSACAVP